MLVFIRNTPRAYAWGSREALPELLGTTPTGEPQAELWLGAHPGAPATVAKGIPSACSLIELIEHDPDAYGVNGGQLPFLLKVLAIGAPLSLQVHPDLEQARAGFAAEEAAGVPRDAPGRNYGDPNHKPELLVALSEVTALSGFRDLAAAVADLAALVSVLPAGAERAALEAWREQCVAEDAAGQDPAAVRRAALEWALGGAGMSSGIVPAAVRGIASAVRESPEQLSAALGADRLGALRELTDAYPDDPGVLVSLLLHLVRLQPGESIFLGARQLHAYLSGIGVEVMAASDNVLRAGLTVKHIDTAELLRITDTGELADPRFVARPVAPGLLAYEPEVPDFRLFRARLCEPQGAEETPFEEPAFGDGFEDRAGGRAPMVRIEAPYPLVLIATSGRVRVERPDADFDEVASVRRGQSLYISAGTPIELSGVGEAFLATVGE